MTKTKVLKLYKAGPFIRGQLVSYGMPVLFKYNLNTGKVTWHGEDPEDGFVDAMMLSDKYGLDYRELGNFIADKCRSFAERNGYR